MGGYVAPCLCAVRCLQVMHHSTTNHIRPTPFKCDRMHGVHTRLVCNVWRPHIDDVDRLSKGDGAKRRGTGSRDIPHRLNAEERPLYEFAKKKGYLAVRGTGYRRERKGNPLPNVYRQWCDAKAMATIVIEQDAAGGQQDVVVVDLASLRLRDSETQAAAQVCLQLAAQLGLGQVESRPEEAVPFNINPSPLFNKHSAVQATLATDQPMKLVGAGQDGGQETSSGVQHQANTPGTTVQQLEAQVAAAGAKVRHLKEVEGCSNSSVQVQEHVAVLKQLKAQLASAQVQEELAGLPRTSYAQALFAEFGNAGAASPSPQQPSMITQTVSSTQQVKVLATHTLATLPANDDPLEQCAIWAIPARPLFFAGPRNTAKLFAKEAAAALTMDALSTAH